MDRAVNSLNIIFAGPDAGSFSEAADSLAEAGHKVQCVSNVFKALTANTRSPADLTVIDASGLDDQMLEVFEALKEAAPECVLLAAVTSAARSRSARVLNFGSDAIIGLPVSGDEIEALLEKRRQAAKVEKASVDDKFEWLGEFAGGVAHNINNPLTTVVGYLQILRSQAEDSDQMSDILSVMLRECDRISEIVKRLLLFSGSNNVALRPVDVNRAVEAALLVAGTKDDNDNVEVKRSYQPGLPAVMGDEEALKLACENIALNARKAMRNGGTLSVETAQDGPGRVTVEFTDSGPSIPEENLHKIFEPFYDGGNSGGPGLGLAASYGIIKAHGGTIRAKNNKDKGATFLIELPAGT